MAKIIIERKKEYINAFRDYRIYIDNKRVGSISNGQTKEFTIASGKHMVIGKIDWCSSREIGVEASDNEIILLKIEGFKHGSWISLIGLATIIFSYFLPQTNFFFYLVLLCLPMFLILMYYITFGRQKYLQLSEPNYHS